MRKFIAIILTVCVLSFFTNCKQDSKVKEYVIGGEEVENISEIPWQVALIEFNSNPRESFCGGSIIDENWIVTAAHCVYQIDKSTMSIYSGSESLDGNGLISNIKRIIIHPKYNNETLENDIALIELQTPLVFNDSTDITLIPDLNDYSEFMTVGNELTVSGWGIVDIITNDTSRVLMQAAVPIRNQKECQKNYDEDGNYGTGAITNNMFCASGNERDSCFGDSGGPLFGRNINNEGVLLGVVSWGPIDCANEKLFGIYTNVFNYRDWININCDECFDNQPNI